MKNLTIEEIQAMKALLESEVTAAFKKFEASSGVKLSDVETNVLLVKRSLFSEQDRRLLGRFFDRVEIDISFKI